VGIAAVCAAGAAVVFFPGGIVLLAVGVALGFQLHKRWEGGKGAYYQGRR